MKKKVTMLTIMIAFSLSANFYPLESKVTKKNQQILKAKIVFNSLLLITKQPTNVLNQIWENSTWNDDSRETFIYNSNGFLTNMTAESIVNNNWILDMKTEVEYSSSNLPNTYTTFIYNEGIIEYGSKLEFQNNDGKTVESIQYSWNVDMSDWQLESKEEYEYNGENSTKTTSYSWNVDASDWELYGEDEITYDDQSREIVYFSKLWNSDSGEFQNSNITNSEYHQNGKLSKRISKSWDENTQNWSEGNYSMFEYEYDGNDNLISEITTFAMEFFGMSFLTKTKIENEYDSNQYLIAEHSFMWDETFSDWIEMSKSDFTNDNEGSVLIKIVQNKILDTWENAEKHIYNYDGTVDITDEQNLLNDFSLSQNYPNPFNPSTTISYSIEKAGNVEIVVYDILGNVIAELVNKFQNAGKYSVKFNAENLSSGIYVYKIKSGSFEMSNKCLLLK